MPFNRIPGLKGQVYIPEKRDGRARKHNCIDCFSCQMCSDVRCEVCRCEKEKQCNKESRPFKSFLQNSK